MADTTDVGQDVIQSDEPRATVLQLADLDMGGASRITGLSAPTTESEPIRKQDLDAIVAAMQGSSVPQPFPGDIEPQPGRINWYLYPEAKAGETWRVTEPLRLGFSAPTRADDLQPGDLIVALVDSDGGPSIKNTDREDKDGNKLTIRDDFYVVKGVQAIASEDTPGIIQIANPDDVIAGTDDTKAITPQALSRQIQQLKESLDLSPVLIDGNGYQAGQSDDQRLFIVNDAWGTIDLPPGGLQNLSALRDEIKAADGEGRSLNPDIAPVYSNAVAPGTTYYFSVNSGSALYLQIDPNTPEQYLPNFYPPISDQIIQGTGGTIAITWGGRNPQNPITKNGTWFVTGAVSQGYIHATPFPGEVKFLWMYVPPNENPWKDPHGNLWYVPNGKSIGSKRSPADIRDDRFEYLYKVLHTSPAAEIVGGKTTAFGDWNAGKEMKLPNTAGTIPISPGIVGDRSRTFLDSVHTPALITSERGQKLPDFFTYTVLVALGVRAHIEV